jgi:hypothetical protein
MTRRPGPATLDGADSGPTRWTPSRTPADREYGDDPENLAGARWPGSDAAILALLPLTTLVSWSAVVIVRRSWPPQPRRRDDSRTEIEVA